MTHVMIDECKDPVSFEVDGIRYVHPYYNSTVCVRPMIQIYDGDMRLAPMAVYNNTPKNGLMDSPVDEEWVKEFWG